MILVVLALIDINIYTNKNTYLLGEDIWVWWEIINTGDSADYIEEGCLSNKLWRNYLERSDSTDRILRKKHLRIWDENNKRVPYVGVTIKGAVLRKKGWKFKIPKPGMKKIEPGDTLKSEKANIKGYYGNLKMDHGLLGRGRGYLGQGKYHIATVCRTRINNKIKNIRSDTLYFSVNKPEGRELVAKSMYKRIKKEVRNKNNAMAIKFAYYILKRYPESNYTCSILNIDFFNRPTIREETEEFKKEARKLLDYLENNIDKFTYDEMTFNRALWCIIPGEFMFLTPVEKVKDFIENLDYPVDEEILEYFGIEKKK